MEKDKTQEAFVAFHNEDEPFYKHADILPYWFDTSTNKLTLYLRSSHPDHPTTFHGSIREIEPSIMFTIARILIEQSYSFFPLEDCD